MNVETLKKITPWIPLMIAAGYFLFLVGSWHVMTANLKAADARFDAMIERVEKDHESRSNGGDL